MNDKVTIKLEKEKGKIVELVLKMPSIQDAWMLSSAFKKHIDFETAEEVRKDLIRMKELQAKDDDSDEHKKLMSEKAYNLSLKIDTCKDFNDACIVILQNYFEKITGDLPPEDMKLNFAQRLMQQQWFRKNFGLFKTQLFLQVGMVFFVDHLHMLPLLQKTLGSK